MSPKSERLVTPERSPDDTLESSLRPKTLSDFVGQQQARENLKVFIDAAKGRGEALDHVLFSGPPGLGKTTLAQIVARELGVNFRSTSGPVLAKAGDLAAILTNLEPRDVLFIDEIHRLSPAVEEILYPAMEDFELDLVIGEGPSARSVKIQLAPFTLVGATTRSGLITTPLRDRFGIPVRLNFYTADELCLIVERGARVRGGDVEHVDPIRRIPLSPKGRVSPRRPALERFERKREARAVAARDQHVGDHDLGPFPSEAARGGSAHAGCRSADDCDLVFQTHDVNSCWLPGFCHAFGGLATDR